MKKSKRIFSLILASLLLASALVSCAEDTQSEETGKTPTNVADPNAAVESVADETEEMYVKDDLPTDLNFNDDTATILCWTSWDKTEFFVEEDTGEIVDTAVYNRNLTTEERLGVKLEWFQPPHDGSWRGYLSRSVTAGDFSYDVVAGYADHPGQAAVAGELMDMRDIKHIDLEKPWYYESAKKAGTFGGFQYLIAGDHSYNALARMSVIYFNVDMLVNKNLEDPYELVLANEWTLDKLIEMCAGTWEDLDGDGEMKYGKDIVGLMCAHDQIQTTYYSAGNVWCTLDENNFPLISDDVYGEKVTNLIDKWIRIFDDSGIHGLGDNDDPGTFAEGKALFYVYPMGHVQDAILRQSDITYGLVPQPKYDQTQENYIASVTNAVTMWGIPLVVENPDLCGAVLECFGSEGYRQVTPVFFEQAFGVKYNSDDSGRQTQIFDELRENIHFDLGKVFSASLFQGVPNSVYANCIWNETNTYSSQMKSYQRALTRSLTKLRKDLGLAE